MILKYYGGSMNTQDIEELFHLDHNGTNAYDMVEGMKRLDFDAKGVFCKVEDLLEGNVLLPCIAHVALNQSYAHFVVIYEINKRKQQILVADPANKIIKMSVDIFRTIFTGNIITLYPLKPLTPLEEKSFSMKNLWPFLKICKPILWQCFFSSLFILLYAILGSLASEWMLKGIDSKKPERYFVFLFGLFASCSLLKLLLEFLRNRLFLWIEKKVDIQLSMDIFEKVLSLSYRYYHNHTSGDILSRIQALDDVKKALSKWIMVLMIDLPLMIVTFFILYFMNQAIAIMMLLFFLLQLLLLKLFASPLEEKIASCQQEQASLSTMEIEGIQSFETVKGISLASYFQKKWSIERTRFLKKIHDLEKLLTIENFGKQFCEEMSSLTLLLLGCLLVRRGNLYFGTLLTIENLSLYFFTPVREFVDLDSDTKQAKKAMERISIFNGIEEKRGFYKTIENNAIQFLNLSFSYRPNQEILRNIQLSIKSGEKVMILGPSGSGKSTLFKLLKGYYEIPRRKIKIGGKDLCDYDNTNLICYIHQTEYLYTESLLENIQLSKNVEEKELEDITSLCQLEEIIRKENLGYLQLIEENGQNLSGGERQRIILARTLLCPFQILIIDEGLNQLDVHLERKILKQMFQKFSMKTIIVISHREENLDLFDRKIRLENGRIREDVTR